MTVPYDYSDTSDSDSSFSDSTSSDSDISHNMVETGRKMWSEMVKESLDRELELKHGINYRKSLDLQLQRAVTAIKEKRLNYPMTLPTDSITWKLLGNKSKPTLDFVLENCTDSECDGDLELYQEPKHLNLITPRLMRPPLCRMAAHSTQCDSMPLPEIERSTALGVKGANLILSGDIFVDLPFIQEGVYSDPESGYSYHIRRTDANLIITCVIKS